MRDELDKLSEFLDGANAAAEHPDADRIAAYGALSFLYLRSDRYRAMPLPQFRRLIQPPIDLGFHKVFEDDGVRRAAVLWAFLNPETERRFVTERRLDPGDWLSGDRMWVIEIVAPYGQRLGGTAMNWLRHALPDEITRVRYMRTRAGNEVRHIVEVNRGAGRIWGARIIQADGLA